MNAISLSGSPDAARGAAGAAGARSTVTGGVAQPAAASAKQTKNIDL